VARAGSTTPAASCAPWSDVSQFLFRGDTDDDTPVLVSPADGATVENPVLVWDSVPGIGKYKVTIDSRWRHGDRHHGGDVVDTDRQTVELAARRPVHLARPDRGLLRRAQHHR
jgi:hypothetical protein